MNAHSRKIYEAITEGRAPRDLEWTQFVRFWEDVADDVQQESGDRIAVHANGRRVVFRRPNDGVVPVEDIGHARQLLADNGDAADAPSDAGSVVAVVIDDRQARVLEVALDASAGGTVEQTVRDSEPDSRHLRTVERHAGGDDKHELTGFFDDVAAALTSAPPDAPVIVFGHGTGTSSAAEALVERLRDKHSTLAHRVSGVRNVDISAVTDAQLEQQARAALGRG